ncbi:MAG: 2-dehydropantoate 2-reductase [Crocinitomicaceae bacterium]|nr:2-dehydropantoate 2-reductase [Crocinitomicaceae bacterium]
MTKNKILIVGIGGVGGYFGGLLAKKYQQNDDIEICFLSRSENLRKIKSEGIRVFDDENEFIARPDLVSDNIKDFGLVDYALICTKTYNLTEVAQQIAPCISDTTVLIPLQNGVDSRGVLLNFFPRNLITHGCVYLVSRLESPGLIQKKGQVGSLFFGLNNVHDVRLGKLQEILVKAGVKSELSLDINKVIWEKFIFLSSIATSTTYFDSNVHEILESSEKLEFLKSLIKEVIELAQSKEIQIGNKQIDRVLGVLSTLPLDATTSMHSDFRSQNKRTELESLTGFVVKEGRLDNVSIQTFEMMYNGIKKMSNTVYSK